MKITLAALAVTACSPTDPGPTASKQSGCATRAYAEIGGPIALIDHTGAPRTEADFKGRPSLVYFGFTYCPDICPQTLVTVERALRRLPEDVDAPRTILISVDAERDTPEAMATYINSDPFPDDIVGLTGSDDAIRAAANSFKADYMRIEQPDSLAGYTMDHTSIVYLMDEDWSLKTFFLTNEETDESMATCLAEQLS